MSTVATDTCPMPRLLDKNFEIIKERRRMALDNGHWKTQREQDEILHMIVQADMRLLIAELTRLRALEAAAKDPLLLSAMKISLEEIASAVNDDKAHGLQSDPVDFEQHAVIKDFLSLVQPSNVAEAVVEPREATDDEVLRELERQTRSDHLRIEYRNGAKWVITPSCWEAICFVGSPRWMDAKAAATKRLNQATAPG